MNNMGGPGEGLGYPGLFPQQNMQPNGLHFVQQAAPAPSAPGWVP
eukprot:CAMPEP_0180316976 /NCGR_PEP_ID=MMETSP0988-20121125/33572_1 /TAXON_ID=697907 /ORGANISM="non described non described, Strain CCMP2293" /LENGTH=44 /DNA_ID= /DNA_START= /DNA_END= /DNA_ORIENTATION=